MNPTALRPLSKIASNVLQNSCRCFSFKFEMTPRFAQESTSAAEETATTQKPAAPVEETPTNNFRYNVCQPRTTPVQRPSTVGDVVATQRRMVQEAIEQQNLQPSMLPEYYSKRMDKSPLVTTEPDPSEEDRINNAHKGLIQRRFQVSKTYANAILPLKSVKLANPFPEPVKMMMSRTVSDEEKAQQMLAEARTQRTWGNSSSTGSRREMTTSANPPKRCYSSQVSSDSDKCKKLKKGNKKGSCPKMHLNKCPPRARQNCERNPVDLKCKKQEAPYPAYSEFCHEEPYEKPSECKICPWKPDENPYFKPKKRHFHTSSVMEIRRSGLEQDEWEDIVKTEPPMSLEEIEEKKEPPEKTEGMQCDLRKPPCDRPKSTRCPPKSGGKKDDKKKPSSHQKKKKAESSNPELEEIIFDEARPQSVLILKGSRGNEKGGCKIRKFKFPECNNVQKRPKVERIGGKCPARKKKLPIKDCPPDEEGGCKMEGVVNSMPLEERMDNSMLLEEKVEKDKRKCPQVDLTIRKMEEGEDEDPCKKKKQGTTKICPGDLLKKKRRNPRKKTSGVLTSIHPETPNNKEPQPTVRTSA